MFQSSWMPSFTVLIEFNFNVNCVKTITFVMKMYIKFSVPEFKDAFFMVFIEFNLNVNCVKTITFVMEIFIIFLFLFMDAFFYGIYRIQFKCKLCKERITFVMKIFTLFLFQDSWMPSFSVFVEFNLNVNCVRTK